MFPRKWDAPEYVNLSQIEVVSLFTHVFVPEIYKTLYKSDGFHGLASMKASQSLPHCLTLNSIYRSVGNVFLAPAIKYLVNTNFSFL